jgi:uncharacterized protein with PIN domain
VVEIHESATFSLWLQSLRDSQTRARIAMRVRRLAFGDFGKGSGHPAGLNFGDCFTYALAREKREPVLWKGDDFRHTDLRAAV